MRRVIMTVSLSALLSAGVSEAGADLAVGDEQAFFRLLDLERGELAAVKAAVDRQQWDVAKAAWATHLEQRTAPRWTWSYRDRERIKAVLEAKFGGLSRHVPQAEKVLRREFSWLGVSRTLTHNMDWVSRDYEHEWGNVLNRHGYWRTLGLAWWETGDARYAEDWVSMLHDWIDDNPVKPQTRGPWRTLEVGFRATSWFDLMSIYMEAPAFDAEAKYAMTRSLVEHARLLDRDILARGFQKGNWQLSKSRGLATVGIMLPECKEAAAWRELGFEILRTHMENGVYPDGGHCELTPGYHFHCMNAFLGAVILARKNGYDIAGMEARHEKMFEFLMQLTKPDRTYAPVGDAGTGTDGKIAESMSLGAFLYGRRDMRYLAPDGIRPSWVWLFSQDRLAEYAALPAEKPTLLSHMMPHSRYGVMRTGWEKEDRWLLFDCAPWGGAHSHGDRLQVCLYSGRDLLIDPGQYSYDQPLAKTYFRSAKAHNVLLLDEEDQPKANPEVLSWNVSERVEFASGRIRTKDHAVTHQRSILFVKPDYWVVVDHVTGTGDPTLTRLFHFPDVTVTHTTGSVRTRFTDGDNVWIGVVDDARVEMRQGWIVTPESKRKAEAVEAPVAAFVSEHPLPVTLCTVLVPFRSAEAIPEVERLPQDNPGAAAVRVHFPDGRTDWIAMASTESDLQAGSHSGKGIALCARSTAGETTIDVIRPEPLQDE